MASSSSDYKTDFKVQVSVSLPLGMVTRIDEIAYEQNQSRTQFVRTAIEKQLNETKNKKK